MKGRPIPYTEAELTWIEARKHLPRKQLHTEFCTHWKRDDVSCENLKRLCFRKGWGTGRTGCFEPGHPAHNKGKKMPYHPNSARTQFKKGTLPHSYRGAGHERIDSKYGYVIMIVDEPNPWTGAKTRPVIKHRYLWEKANGPLPTDYCLKCLDGDKTNTDPSNWEAIPRAMLPRLNGRFGRNYDDAPPELKPTILAIAKLEHEAREAKKTG